MMTGLTFGVTLGIYFSLLIFYVAGQPPKHCHYLVPVKTKPGIYACSKYPRALVKP